MTAVAQNDDNPDAVPDRIIRDRARRSPTLQTLSDAAERAWWRLTVSADDHGRFEAHPEVLLATLFARRPGGWTPTKMQRVILEWETTGLVALYSISSRVYLCIPSWGTHQRPPRLASKYPDPPDMLTVPAERTLHQALHGHFLTAKRFCGHDLSLVDRNVRIGNGFADFVLTGPAGRIVIEVKRTRADKGAIRQISGYLSGLKGALGGAVIATGFGPTVGPEDFAAEALALIVYDAHGRFSLAVPSPSFKECDIPEISLGHSVIYAESPNLQGTRDEKREARDEKREALSSPRGDPPQGAPAWPSPQALVELYNAETPDECPAVTKLSPARRKKAQQYLAAFPDREWWVAMFRRITGSRLLRGLKPSPGHEYFRADFDWLLSKGKDGTENCLKVAEGKFD